MIMGREIKRVALDFDWPMHYVWKGFLSPYSPTQCKMCDGSGLNEKTKELSDNWYTHLRADGKEGWGRNLEQEDVQALIDAGRLMNFTRVPINDEQREIVEKKIADGGNSWLPFDNGYIPTAKEVNDWDRKGFGHDSCNHWICTKSRAKRLGFYGLCPLCGGNGYYWADDKFEVLSEEWDWIEPPEGDGYQMWETTSEGSPISPVFATPEELARWLADNNASTFGKSTTTYENWLKFIRGPGWAPSMISDGQSLKSGVDAIG